MIRRPTDAQLRPFIKRIWFSETAPAAVCEHSLPSGDIHIAVRLSGPPLRLLREAAADEPEQIGFFAIGGPRSRFYIKDTSSASMSLGAVLRPGASLPLLGVPAADVAGRHVSAADLWTPAIAARAMDRLHGATEPGEKLAAFEAILAERITGRPALHPCVTAALEMFDSDQQVAQLVSASGYSHRHFAAMFRMAVGLLPKEYDRVRRFLRAVAMLQDPLAPSLAAIAACCGYSDQAHFHRDFHSMSGVTPTTYRRLAPARSMHVPVLRRIG